MTGVAPALEVRPAAGDGDLRAILALQASQLAATLGPEAAARDGFVTVRHDLETLRRMHALAPSVVAAVGGPAGDAAPLAGYALVMPVEAAPWVPVLAPMFELLRGLSFRGRALAALRHYVMGQVCVAPAWRGRGVFDALYDGHRRLLAGRYDVVVTEISARNGRSLRAHARVGFETIHRYRDATDDWAVVAMALGPAP
ncbi:MAG: GNAT family N-acetyltransferase [Anaeromyxobacteraceae bacterium]